MVKQPTVLLLGAGASKPYGMPLGAGLVNLIAYPHGSATAEGIHKELDFLFEALEKGQVDMNTGKLYKIGGLRGTFEQLKKGLQRLSPSISFDYYLKQNYQFMDVGKMVIALVIHYLESREAIFNAKNDEDWYPHLWQQITAPTYEAFCDQPLRIYTFNYDLTLDYFLYHQINNYYRRTDKLGKEKPLNFSPAEILMPKHIYGSRKVNFSTQNAFKNFEGPGSNGFMPALDDLAKFGLDATTQIHLIDEDETNEIFDNINKDVNSKKRVYILGFGFDPANTARLKFREWASSMHVIEALMFKFTDQEIRNTKEQIFGDMKMQGNVQLHNNMDCKAFIRGNGFLK